MNPHNINSLVASVRELVEGLKSLRQKVKTKQAERAAIASAPAARTEVLQYVAGWVDTLGADFEKTFRERMRPVFLTADAVDAHDGRVGRTLTVLGLARHPEAQLSPAGQDPALCWVLREPLKAALTKIVDELDLPYGLPRAARQAKLAQLDAELTALLAQEGELLAAATAAGVVLE